MAPAYKLTYFEGRGAAESIRLLFRYGGLEFEDNRIKRDDWPKIKANYPFGQLPVLEHNGKVVNQSVCIARYIAKQVKLAGNNDWENLEIDAIVDSVKDLALKLTPIFYEQDETKKAQLKENLLKETIPYFLQRLDDSAKKNGGYLAVGRLTWADIYLVSTLELVNGVLKTDVIANYPNLTALRTKVVNIPKIKAWIEVRPKTEF